MLPDAGMLSTSRFLKTPRVVTAGLRIRFSILVYNGAMTADVTNGSSISERFSARSGFKLSHTEATKYEDSKKEILNRKQFTCFQTCLT